MDHWYCLRPIEVSYNGDNFAEIVKYRWRWLATLLQSSRGSTPLRDVDICGQIQRVVAQEACDRSYGPQIRIISYDTLSVSGTCMSYWLIYVSWRSQCIGWPLTFHAVVQLDAALGELLNSKCFRLWGLILLGLSMQAFGGHDNTLWKQALWINHQSEVKVCGDANILQML